MFRIKICGITSPADALAAAEAGADAIGLNFCPASKRVIDPARAREIIRVLPGHVAKVGVFADMQAAQIIEIADRLGLDLLQLHGRETPADLAQLGDRALIKAFGCGPSGHEAVLAYLAACQPIQARPRMVLLDADCTRQLGDRGQLGGTGRLADWQAAGSYGAQADVPLLVLAGGLTAENVGQAIRTVRPTAVDTASGVESAAGIKDRDKVVGFVTASRAAFAELDRDH